jgi:predicted cupin superfamily sugar epimerase
MKPDDIIQKLNMQPHPEGGHYVEIFRDERITDQGRSYSSAIYFLLQEGEQSDWHRVDATEIWHWYAGAPLKLSMHTGQQETETLLGPDLFEDQRPQRIVPTGAWQKAQSCGAWTLVGCTVAPAFEFAGFDVLPKNQTPAKNAGN